MNRWIALSDQPPPPGAPQAGVLPCGILVFEIDLPLAGAGVLIDLRSPASAGAQAGQGEAALSLFHDLGAGISLMLRQGERMLRHMLPGPLWQKSGVAQLTFAWDVPARGWSLTLEQGGRRLAAQGRGGFAPDIGLVHRLCAGGPGVVRHPSVQWFGLSPGHDLPLASGWIGPATPVLTPRGPVAAGRLEPGDRVMTRDQGPVPLLRVTRLAAPGRGNLAPIRLWAPFWGRRADLLVSPDQPVLLTGAEAEYLLGNDQVLAQARHLTDGTSASVEDGRAGVVGVVLDLGMAELIEADGCFLATAGPPGSAHPRPMLDAFEAQSLRLALARAHQRAI